MDVEMVIGIICVFLFFGVCAYAASKESKTVGVYRTFGVFGRWKAYFSAFAPLGVLAAIGIIIDSIRQRSFARGSDLFSSFIMIIIGIVPVFLAYRHCPDFLKKKCIPSMFLCGLGLYIKIVFFFLPNTWEVIEPDLYNLGDGRSAYRINDDLYTEDGVKVGTMNADGETYTTC